MNDNGDLWLNAGLMLSHLPSPMTKDEVRAFAARAVDAAAQIEANDMLPMRQTLLVGILEPELRARGARHPHILYVSAAALHACDNAKTLTEARELLGSVWAGVAMGKAQ